MQQAHLLIVDGETFRTPDLSSVMAREGWEVVWAQGTSGLRQAAEGALPDVVLFDPLVIGEDGLKVVRVLQARNANLPLVALGGTSFEKDWPERTRIGAKSLHRMGREISFLAWPATLRSCLGGFGPGAQKFTTEDLFGDIIGELEGGEAPPSPLPPTPPVPPPPPPPPLPPPPPVVPEDVPPAEDQPSKDFTFSSVFGISDAFRLQQTDIKTSSAHPSIHEPWAPPAPPAGPEPPMESMEEFGNYYLLEKVAVGGMAELFKARQRGVHDFEKIVAIKRILPHLSDNDEFVRMFIDEAKLAAQLTHPNIVQIFDLGKAMGFYYIAMEFVDGRDLRSLLRKVREYRLPVPEPLAAAVAMKMASALDYAHRKRGINDKELKLVHRDISPQNILISYEGAVKLVDFGIAKAATKSTQTMAGALKGKLLYMSPEQALGQSLDGRSDIYSLGLVLFELLTGERCFQADSELGVLEKVRLGKVADVRAVNPSVSPEMADLVAKALHKDVEQRYASARFLERDLKDLLVRTHSEPNEHDLAEYVNTVLKGTKEGLEALLNLRYPTSRTSGPLIIAPELPAAPSVPVRVAPVAAPAPLAPWPKPTHRPMSKDPRPFWLLPVLAGVVALVAWAAYRLFGAWAAHPFFK